MYEHTGKSMSLASLEKLSHPQAQPTQGVYRGDLYLRGLPEIPLTGIESAFVEFPGKIVLMHHERRPIQAYASVDAPAEDRRCAYSHWGIVTFACMAALFALLVAALSNF